MIDENLTWKTHIELVENKISKNVGILFKASRYFKATLNPCVVYILH